MKPCACCGINPRVIHAGNKSQACYCKQCWTDKARAWNKKNRERVKDRQLKRKFGKSLIEFREMEVSQGGVCSICFEPCSSGRELSQDHNHTTKKNRGLLCGTCNRGIGLLKESPALLHRSIEYLNQWKLIHEAESV
jgi:hypothetical protein